MESLASAVRIRLVVELRIATRDFVLDLPRKPSVGDELEIPGGRLCVVTSVETNEPRNKKSTVQYKVRADPA